MNLSELTMRQLMKLGREHNLEIFKRTWFIYAGILVIAGLIFLYDHINSKGK